MPNGDAEQTERVGADRHRSRGVVAATIVGGIVVVDQVTKVWAVAELADGPVGVFGADVGFRLVRNSGGAFSLFQGFAPLLAVVAVGVAWWLVRTLRRSDDLLMVVALSMVLGGALGNLIDRMVRAPGFLRGAVVDFVRVGTFPTFNVADASITLGVVLAIVAVVRADRREARA